MSRTGLHPTDIAKSFRDRCGDGSVEWVYTPMQTCVLLDAADMLDENDRLRNEFRKMDEWHSKELLAAVDNNDKLRELVRDVVLLAGLNGCDVTKMQMHAHGGDWRTVWERMAELGVPGTEVDA